MIRAKHPIRHNGVTYKKGVLIENLSDEAEKHLVNLKAAEYVISPDEEVQQQQQSEQTFSIDPKLFENIKADLDNLYNADELKREAKAVGVDLTGITKKEDVIAAIINQGKADELLEDEELGGLDD